MLLPSADGLGLCPGLLVLVVDGRHRFQVLRLLRTSTPGDDIPDAILVWLNEPKRVMEFWRNDGGALRPCERTKMSRNFNFSTSIVRKDIPFGDIMLTVLPYAVCLRGVIF